jgi:hypothetical protein
MSIYIKLPSEFQCVYQDLFEKTPDECTIQLIINELRRRHVEYRLMDKIFRAQYRMEFDEFKKKRIFESSGRSYEVERDYCDWELAIDGIQTVSAELRYQLSKTLKNKQRNKNSTIYYLWNINEILSRLIKFEYE